MRSRGNTPIVRLSKHKIKLGRQGCNFHRFNLKHSLKNSEAWNEIKIQKDKRDEANGAVKKLKEQRTEIISQLKTKREDFSTLSGKANKLLARTPRSIGSVKHQIEK